MVSVIICSASPEKRENIRENITKTIGVEHEFIIHDNTTENRLGICQAYNVCASKAKYDYLCFVHEDVEFRTDGWGRQLVLQASKDYSGVIGFAGGTVATKTPLCWGDLGRPYIRTHIKHSGELKFWNENPDKENFSEVISLDGVMLFCKKSVWEAVKFNEDILHGFHCYDIDFSIRASRYYKNYVCHTVDIIHGSKGKFSKEWFDDIQRVYEPLKERLPRCVSKLSPQEMLKVNEKAQYEYLRRYVVKLCSIKEAYAAVKRFSKDYPESSYTKTLYAKFLIHSIVRL